MAYTLPQISDILLKSDRTMYRLGSIAYENMFSEDSEDVDYERDIIYIYKVAVEYADNFYVGTDKLDTVVEKLAAKIAVYDFGQLTPIYSDATIVTQSVPVGAALDDLSDVTITNVQNNQTLRYSSSLGQWINVGPGAAVRNRQQFTATLNQTVFVTTFPFESGLLDVYLNGVKLSPPSYTTFGNYTITLADGSLVDDIVEVIAYDPATSFIDLSGYVPTSRTLTINGVTYDLSANRTWTIDALPSQAGNTGKYLTTDGVVASWGAINLSGYVPYTGATANVDLGDNDLEAGSVFVEGASGAGGALRIKQFASSAANLDGYSTISTLNTGVFYFTAATTSPNFKNFVLNPSGLTDNTLRTYTLPNLSGTLALLSDIPSITGYVPYTGATQDVDLGEFELKAGQVEFDQTPTGTAGVGVMRWNDSDGTVDLGLKGGNVTLQVGQELVQRVVNKSGINLLEANYQVVRVSDAQGQRLAVQLAQGNNDANSTDTIGIVTETINDNQEGFVTTSGLVRNINTTGSLQGETWIDGDVLYLSPTVAGRITKVKPTAPNHSVILGYVVYAHANNGKIFVKVDNGYEIGELHDVYVPTPSNNDGIFWNTANSRYQNNSIAGVLGYTPISGSGVTGQVAYWNGTNSQTGSNNLFWDAANNYLGVGTNNPLYTFHAISASTTIGAFRSSVAANGQLLVGNTVSDLVLRILASGDAQIHSDTGKYLSFGTNGATERARITSGGNLLVGTTTDAGYRVDINGTLRVTNQSLFEVTDAGVGTKTIVATFGRTGASSSGTSREAGIVFRDSAGTTLTSGITGVRENSAGNWLGGLKFYVASNPSLPSSTFANLTEALSINSSGAATFSSSVTATSFYTQNGGDFGWGDGSTFIDGDSSNQFIRFIINSSERARFNPSGNLLVGTTTDAGQKLQVSGNVSIGASSATTVTSTYNSTTRNRITYTNSSSFEFFEGANERMRLAPASGNLLVGTTTDIASSKVTIESTTQGFLPPRMTNAQRTAISSPAVGLIVYCTDATEGLYQYTSAGWANLNGVVTNRQTASYTLALTDINDLVEMNVATANNLTVPLNSSVAFPIGTNIDIAQYGAGQTTVVATSGVTVRSAGGALKLAVQYSGATLVKIANDEWYLFGDITV